MSSLSDSNSFSNLSTPSNSFPADNSQRESFAFDDLSNIECVCPICDESMISILQLNRHLDDVHMDTSADQRDGIIQWIKKAQTTILNPLSSKTKNIANLPQIAINKFNDLDTNWLDPQSDLVTKIHWQMEDENDICCSNSSCDKFINLRNGKHNCRKCGKLFCDSHCRLPMKLNKQAHHDPIDGYWCRVCDDCFQSRECYLDTEGVIRSHTTTFIKNRTKGIERAHLEGNRLEKRLEKLAKVYATQAKPENSTQSGLKPPLSMMHRRRASEQSIVKWEDDASVTNCPLCDIQFGKITNRRHHCRLCGRVVCEKCSSKISLNLNNYSESADQDSVGEVRACKQCRDAVFRRKEYNEEISKTPPVVMLYQKLMKIKTAIDTTLPKFQDMLIMLKSQEIVNQTHADYQLAARTRKELLDNFAQFDAISKKINSLLSRSKSEKRLQANIHLAATQYLQQNMLPLQNGRTRSISTSSTKSLKGEEKIREQLEVLLEQEKLVQGYIVEATKQRKFDDVKTLKTSLDELKVEINKTRKELGDLWS
ncbi:171_t:CDS:10 [Cetraspora pellucida]|uniref:171_t:CDS:1 n=1 Tax=Cetraspora pellucida TaxID=1433469 RepID=A0ACA9MFA0_9GLOM|nr:171_t:CDS:10 [Cetraspora pellucida]